MIGRWCHMRAHVHAHGCNPDSQSDHGATPQCHVVSSIETCTEHGDSSFTRTHYAVSASLVQAQRMWFTGYCGWILFALMATVAGQADAPPAEDAPAALDSSSWSAPDQQQNDTSDSTIGMLALSSTTTTTPIPAMSPSQIPPKDQCPQCYGESICVRLPNGSYGCHCPPEYRGPLCRDFTPIIADTCNRQVCRNGAVCLILDNIAHCLCPENYVGLQCNRVAMIFQLDLHLHSDSHVVTWFDETQTQGNYQGGKDANVVCNGLRGFIKRGVSKGIAVAWAGCRLHHLHRFYTEKQENGEQASTSGMNVQAHVLFDPSEDGHYFSVDDLTMQLRTGYMATMLSNPTLPNITWDDSLFISEVDVCKSGHHDCSDYATCQKTPGGYTCSCNRAYTDKSSESGYLPGRICSYGFSSGFFLGCIVMLPFIIVTIVMAILCRKKLAQKAWVAGGLSTPPPDTIKLLDSNQARYDV